jgi:hypothetical protein
MELSRTGRIAINRGEYLFGRLTSGDSDPSGSQPRSIRVKGNDADQGVYGAVTGKFQVFLNPVQAQSR